LLNKNTNSPFIPFPENSFPYNYLSLETFLNDFSNKKSKQTPTSTPNSKTKKIEPTKKRCPKGTRKNNKTGECQKIE
jgi:hypothetical protein